MSIAAPFGASECPIIPRNECSAPQSSLLVEPALLPLTQRATYEHAAPFWAAEFPLILRNEFPALPELMVGLDAPLWAAECLLILRNEFLRSSELYDNRSPCWSS